MTTIADTFTQPDGSTVTGWVEVSGDWTISSNRLTPGTAGGTGVIRCGTALTTDDGFAQVVLATAAAVSCGVWCRGDATLSSGYLWRNDGSSWDLFRVLGGSFLSIGSFAGAAVNGDVAKVQAVGSTVKGFVNGVERVSVTDTDVATGKNVGLRCESSAAVRLDDFAAADVGGASDVTGSIAGSFGGLGGAVSATREVPGSVAASFGGLSGQLTAEREVIGSVTFAGGPFVGHVTAEGGVAPLQPATTTQVLVAWLRQYAGYPGSATTVPKPDEWMDDPGYFVRVAGVVGGTPGLYVPDHGPVVQVEVIAAARAAAGAKSTSRKIPRGRAESAMTDICGKTYEFAAGLSLTLPSSMKPVWIESIYPVSEVRELPDPAPNVARYSADIYVGWIERDPVG